MNTENFSPEHAPFRGSKEGFSKAQRRDDVSVNDVEITKSIELSAIWPQGDQFRR